MTESKPYPATRVRDLDDVPTEAVGGVAETAEKSVRRIQSVERALTILEILAAAPDALALGDIAERAGLNASTCHHLVATLVERGYVLNAGRNRGYMLSSRLQELTDVSARKTDLSDFARSDLVELSGRLGLSVQLAEMQGTSLVTRFKTNVAGLHVIEADEVVKMRASHATATGKAILAWLPESQILKVISENGLERFTEHTITSVVDLMEDLRWVRRNGFAVDNEELRLGVVCYGAALRDEKGTVVASVSASFPVELAKEEYREHVVQEVTACARKLSDRLRLGRS
ncbi:IclR family transcriptional regulator [Tropicimonas aquimaris]|uniref:IclR family transcriptional regulator n=1 Tax=Tropicimonas aquimaris TaxID=914152 RepID=A0ABW3IX05_9RHOB